jgi:CheY-like chemotaxis protein
MILIVDDMELSLDIIKSMLLRMGFSDIITIDDPLEAIQSIHRGLSPDIIVSDYTMPGMDGVSLIMAARTTNPAIKGIIITGNPVAAGKAGALFPVIEKGSRDFFKQLVTCLSEMQKNQNTICKSDVLTTPVRPHPARRKASRVYARTKILA